MLIVAVHELAYGTEETVAPPPGRVWLTEAMLKVRSKPLNAVYDPI